MGRASPGVRLTTLMVVVAILALTCAFETEAKAMRSRTHHVPLLWKRTRAMMATPHEQVNMLTSLLLGGDSSNKHLSQSRQTNDEANSFIFLNEGEQSPTRSQFIDSDLQSGRMNSMDFQSPLKNHHVTIFDTPKSYWNLGRPGRRSTAENRIPESSSSYLAPDRKPYSSYREAGRKALMSLGARKILVEPEDREAWKRPTQKFWRRFRSLDVDDRSKTEDKRPPPPPPGFYPIRGKRQSEAFGAGQEDDEEGQTAINRWIDQVAKRIRH